MFEELQPINSGTELIHTSKSKIFPTLKHQATKMYDGIKLKFHTFSNLVLGA